MKKVLIIVISIAVVFTLSTCKSSSSTDTISNNSDDFLSTAYAIKINKNTAGIAQAKTLAAKALTFHKQKKYTEAELEWKNALKHYADAEMYYRFGDTLFNLSRFVDVVKAYKNAIELNHPEKKFVYYNMACAYSRMKNQPETSAVLQSAIAEGYNYWHQIRTDSDLRYFRSEINIEEFIKNYQYEQYNQIIKKITLLDYAKNKNLNFSHKTQALSLTKIAVDLFELKKYGDALLKQIEALNLYADGDMYFNFGNILQRLFKYKEAGEAYILSVKLGIANQGLAYYKAACCNADYRLLKIAIKKGFNDFGMMRNDSDSLMLCFSSLCYGCNDVIKTPDNHELFSYCFTNERKLSINLPGQWDHNTLAPYAAPFFVKYTFIEGGLVKKLTNASAPKHSVVKYGSYILDEDKIIIKFKEQLDIIRTLNASPTKLKKMINETVTIKIIAKNNNILIIKNIEEGLSESATRTSALVRKPSIRFSGYPVKYY